VIKTIINPGEKFQCDLAFPANEPPGLYWYHPHVHGIADPTVLGGATGAQVADGINNVHHPSCTAGREKGRRGDTPNWERPNFNGRRPVASNIRDEESREELHST